MLVLYTYFFFYKIGRHAFCGATDTRFGILVTDALGFNARVNLIAHVRRNSRKNNGNVCDYLRELQKPCRMLLTLYINHYHYNCPLPDSYNGVQCSFCQRDNFNLWCKFRRILNMKNYSILVSYMFYCWRESGSPKQYSESHINFLEVQASHSEFYYPDVPPLSFQHHLLQFKSMRYKPV